MMEVDSRV